MKNKELWVSLVFYPRSTTLIVTLGTVLSTVSGAPVGVKISNAMWLSCVGWSARENPTLRTACSAISNMGLLFRLIDQ